MNRSVNYSQVGERYFVYYDAVRVGDEYFPCVTVEKSIPDGEAKSTSLEVRDLGSFRSAEEARRAATQLDIVEVDEDGTIHLGSSENGEGGLPH